MQINAYFLLLVSSLEINFHLCTIHMLNLFHAYYFMVFVYKCSKGSETYFFLFMQYPNFLAFKLALQVLKPWHGFKKRNILSNKSVRRLFIKKSYIVHEHTPAINYFGPNFNMLFATTF